MRRDLTPTDILDGMKGVVFDDDGLRGTPKALQAATKRKSKKRDPDGWSAFDLKFAARAGVTREQLLEARARSSACTDLSRARSAERLVAEGVLTPSEGSRAARGQAKS